MKEKKAAMTMDMLVMIIILVVGFAIVFYFFVMFDWTGRVDEEVCHQSVIYRATLPSLAGAKEYVPLKCKTDKICITSGLIGGSCKEFENLKGITKMKVKNSQEIEQIIAREIIDCWKMMGEGKVQVFSQWLAEKYGIGDVGSSCVICNRIAFDNVSLEKAGIDLSKIDVMKYMQRHAVPNQNISYYGYLAGQGGKISIGGLEPTEFSEKERTRIQEFLKANKDELGNLGEYKLVSAGENLDMNKKADELAIMFMQVTGPSHGGVFVDTMKAGLSFLGLSFIYKPGAFISTSTSYAPLAWKSTGGFAKGSGAKIVSKGLTPFAKIVAIAAVIGLVAQQGNVAANRAVTAGYCGDVSVGSQARDGCSVVRSINYNVEDISQYCSVIESIP
jgi:hypothetical protein